MALPPGNAVQVFIGLALLLLAAPLLVAGRRRPEGVTLATFLFLVAMNFLLNGASGSNNPGATPYGRAAFVALALDPFFLVAFVTLYPYRRRPRNVRRFQVAMACSAAIGALAVLLVTPVVFRILPPESGGGGLPPLIFPHVLLVGMLAIGYAGAWWLTFEAVREAPSRDLARRALWLTAAVGVAVVPRLAVVPSQDLGFEVSNVIRGFGLPAEYALQKTLETGAQELVLVLLLLALGHRRLARVAPSGLEKEGKRMLTLLAGLVLGLFLAVLALRTWTALGGPDFGQGFVFGARWLVFAAILVYGVLAYELVDFPRASDRAVPLYGALLAATAAFLLVWSVAAARDESETVGLTLGLAVGLGIAAPAAVGARALVRSLVPSATSGATERRLELYRAAIEAAWAEGSPSKEGRDQLERDRRAFGVSLEEARALEHVAAGEAPAGQALIPGDEPVPGLLLGRLLGEGAHGRVFAARRYPSGERVVVKEIRSEELTGTETRRRLLDEVRALRGLHHPNIIGLLDVEVHGGRLFLLMPYVEAEPLHERLARGPLSRSEVHRVLTDVLGALGAAHASGIVHRDVKPSNVLLGKDGRAYLTDFGIAALQPRAGGRTAASMTALGGVAGTPAYMAPEQVLGGKVGPATDLYAAGLLAFEALTGKPALDLAHRSVFESLERAARPSIDLATAPPAWRAWLERALAPVAGDRFHGATEMRDAMP